MSRDVLRHIGGAPLYKRVVGNRSEAMLRRNSHDKPRRANSRINWGCVKGEVAGKHYRVGKTLRCTICVMLVDWVR